MKHERYFLCWGFNHIGMKDCLGYVAYSAKEAEAKCHRLNPTYTIEHIEDQGVF